MENGHGRFWEYQSLSDALLLDRLLNSTGVACDRIHRPKRRSKNVFLDYPKYFWILHVHHVFEDYPVKQH